MEKRKRGRPAGSKNKPSPAFTFAGALKGMKKGQKIYTNREDKTVTGCISALGLAGKFKTERVVVFHSFSHEVEEGVMVTRI